MQSVAEFRKKNLNSKILLETINFYNQIHLSSSVLFDTWIDWTSGTFPSNYSILMSSKKQMTT